MKCFAVLLVCVLSVASAQYARWKPQGARLTLPTEYGAPVVAATEAAAPEQDLEVEITQENVEFVGQLGEIQETTTGQSLDNEYLPPTTTEAIEEAPQENQDPLTVQELPDEEISRAFNEPPKKRVGQLRRIPARFQQQRFARVEEQPKEVYGAPPTPTTTAEPEAETVTAELATETESEVEEVEDEAVEASIAVANAGQYYVLAPDNTLQKVTFLTRQTEDDRRNNGFTAELRYAPVQPIRDPIYAYNEVGQLVKVYNN